MHKRMKPLFSYNFGKGIVSNRLRFSLIFSLLFLAMFATTTAEGLLQERVTLEDVEDVDPNTPGEQPGFVLTIYTENGEDFTDERAESYFSPFPLFFLGDGDLTYDEYTGFKSYTRVDDNTFEFRIGDLPSNEEPPSPDDEESPPPDNEESPPPDNEESPPSDNEEPPPAVEPPLSESSTGNSPTSPSQPEQRTDPTNKADDGGNGVVASGSTGATTPTPQPPPSPRVTTLRIVSGNAQTAKINSLLPKPLFVQVNDQYNAPMADVSITFSVSTGGVLSETAATTDANGYAYTYFTLGSIPGTYQVTAEAIRTTVSQTFTAEATAPILSRLEVRGESRQSVFVGKRIATPLTVRVLDTDNDPVADVGVTFAVVSDSTGTARPLTRHVQSNTVGLAAAYFKPLSPGTIWVDATVGELPPVRFMLTAAFPPVRLVKISGDAQVGAPGATLKDAFVVEALDKNGDPVSGAMVRFSVTAGGGTLSAASATTDSEGRAETLLTLGWERGINSVRGSVTGVDPVIFNTRMDPTIHVAAANRPVMYWIDGGVLYRLAGAEVERIAANANDVAVDMVSGKIYWIEGTSATTGRIHSAYLDGTSASVLQELTSVPHGLALDSANNKLYLTNSWGKIQRMNIDGTQFETNLIVGLDAPMSIAVSSGRVYWTDAAGNVRYANTEGTKVVRTIAVGASAIGGIAVGSSKVYWTEQTSDMTGKIRSANLDGTGVTDLFTLTAVPAGIAVDAAAGKVYWANGWGKIQRRDLSGAKFQDVVTGLVAPGAVVIGGAAADDTAVAAAPARVVAAPDENLLLPNYPNPFNPETWIPYELATDTHVRITIYDTQGVVVRRLELGHQSAGYYTSRDRAAYWDGRNTLGESVASGLYFYQLETEQISQMRKMVILK